MDQKLVQKVDDAMVDLARSLYEEAEGAKSAQTAFEQAVTVCKRSIALKRAVAMLEGRELPKKAPKKADADA